MKYGYARVSSKDQCAARQIRELKLQGLTRNVIYVDKKSGKDFDRTNYQRLRRKLQKDDLLIVKSIDRLGRNYTEILDEWRYITKEIKADIRILDMPLLDTTVGKDLTGTLIADIVLQLLSYVAQSERENIHRRQQEGIEAAKERGVRFGRPEANTPVGFKILSKKWRNGEITAAEAADVLGMNVRTFYRKVSKEEAELLRKAADNPASFDEDLFDKFF